MSGVPGILPGPSRLARLAAAMREQGLDALVAASPANVLYLTGFALGMESLTLSAGGHPLLAVLVRGFGPATLVAPITDAVPLIFRRSPARYRPYGKNFVVVPEQTGGLDGETAAVATLLRSTAPSADAVRATAEILMDAGARRVGIDDTGIPGSLHGALLAALPRVEVSPAATVFRAARAMKEPDEIGLLRKASEIVEAAMAAVWQAARPGVTEEQLARRAVQVMVSEGARPTLWYVGVGGSSALVDRLPTDRKIAAGDLVMLDFGCEYGGYYADLARTAVVGRANERISSYYAAIREGEHAGIARIRPGGTGAEVFYAAVEAIRAAGIPHFDRRHCGHGIGLEPYDEPLVVPATTAPFQPGMVVNVETPYYELGWGGLQLEDTVVVTEDGVEFLSSASRDLLVL